MSNGRQTNGFPGVLLLSVIVVLVFLYVWPGTLRYEYRDVETQNVCHPVAIKIDRLTHKVYYWSDETGEWKRR